MQPEPHPTPLLTAALLCALFSLAGCGGGGSEGEPTAGAPPASTPAAGASGGTANHPADILDGLKTWKLTLPTSATRSATSADEIRHPALATYSSSHFALNDARTAIVLTDIFGGARTSSGTAYARTELRELSANGSANAAWSCTATVRSMSIRQRIVRSPLNKPEMSVGQIHDASNDNLEIRYIGPKGSDGIGSGDGVNDTGRIQAHWNNDSASDVLDSAYRIGDMMQVTISTDGRGNQTVTYLNERTQVTATRSKAFTGVVGSCYFKAGNYHQACTKIDIYGNLNTTCVDKGWASGRYETDPHGKSVLEIHALGLT